MRRLSMTVLLALAWVSPALADLVRVDFTGPVAAGSVRPTGQVLSGSLVYDSDAVQTGLLFNGPNAPPRFDGAITQFELAGIDGSWAANYIYVIDGGPGQGDSIGFVSFSGLSIIFYADSDVLDGPFPPARFPQNWTYAAWEINPPAELFSGGQTSSYSAAIVGSSPTGGERRVLLAANEGIDSAACGNPGNKCRSIGQAIRNARAGDTVFVEVGVYGDLNGNGVLGEAGEEADRTGCGCVVHVDKAITVLSERGAAATIIDARSVAALSPFQTSVVSLGVSGASFGFIGQGFTVLASTAHTGIAIRPGALGVGVWGNRVSGADTGVAGPQADVSDNEITGNFTGISLFEGRVAGNVIARNSGDGIKITGAFAEGNAVIENNVVSGNGGVGMDLPTSTSFMSFVTGNDIVSNGAAGIHWRFGGAIGPRAVVQDNNIFGNRRAFGDHCGILNETYGLVWATDNYWGGLGVADRACDGPNATTVVDPVRTEPDSRVGP